jgi:ABC-type Fe3+/spermidine/putrescine transport system ATPase subunit
MPPADESNGAPASRQAGIGVHGVTKSYGRTAVLQGIELVVSPGEFLCLLGPSGCGKTTLLRCLAGLERPDAGSITIGERVVVDTTEKIFVPPERRRLGMVFQHYALWPHMTVAANIEYPLRKLGIPRAARARKIAEVMKIVGLPALLDRRPGQLSGGQQQRVALARALVYEPPVLLLDEPLSNLDATLRGQLRRELRQLHERLGTTTVLVTHDQEEAAALADTIAVMHHGRVVQIDRAADLLARPRTRFVAEFVGFDNFIRGRVAACHGDRASIALAAGAGFELARSRLAPPVGAEVVVAARSDSLRLYPPDRAPVGMVALRGKVRHIARVGRGLEIEVAAGDQVIIVREAGSGQAAIRDTGAEVLVDFLHATAAIVTDDAEAPLSA